MNSLKQLVPAVKTSSAVLVVLLVVACSNAAVPPPSSGATATPGTTSTAEPRPSPATPPPSQTPVPPPTPAPTPDQAADPHEVILAVETRGGRCVGGPCDNAVLVDRDGTVHLAAKPPNQLGVVPADKMAVLENAILGTDFAEVFSHPFTGTCPIAYDGVEIVFEFATPDAIQQVAGCTVDIDYDSPLFAAVTDAVGEFVPLLD
jgi:hypothetical protein